MWQLFTERARKSVYYAQQETVRLRHDYVSTEHLLLGVIREDDCVAARILSRLGVSLHEIRLLIERQVRPGDGPSGKDIQLTPRGKRVIDLAYDESRVLNNDYVGTEHVLLGLIREGEGLASRVLSSLGVDLETARREVASLQSEGKAQQSALSPPPLRPDPAPDSTGKEPDNGLTQREMEVLRLIGEAHPNGVIAEQVGIGEKTVKSHVGNILSKLNLTDRTQIAVYAWRNGLMKGAAD